MVQASTLGSLEAILTFLGDQKVEVAVVGVGNLNKKDVIKLQIKHAEDETVKKEDLVVLCFDNKVLPEAQKFADENNIKIFVDDVIYHLFDKFIEFKKQCELERKKEKEKEAIFPCHLKTVMFINKKDPLIIGVSVIEGVLKIGTPLYCVEKNLPIGVVESIEREKKPINNVRPNDGDVAIRIKVADSSLNRKIEFSVYTRRWGHFDHYSVSRTINGWNWTGMMHEGESDKEGLYLGSNLDSQESSGPLFDSLNHDSVFFPEDAVKFALAKLWEDADEGKIDYDELSNKLQEIAEWISSVEKNIGEAQPKWLNYY